MDSFRIQLEEVGDDFGFGRVGLEAIGGENGAVVRHVCGAKVGGHRERVVKVGKRGIWIAGAGIKNGLGGGFDF